MHGKGIRDNLELQYAKRKGISAWKNIPNKNTENKWNEINLLEVAFRFMTSLIYG